MCRGYQVIREPNFIGEITTLVGSCEEVDDCLCNIEWELTRDPRDEYCVNLEHDLWAKSLKIGDRKILIYYWIQENPERRVYLMKAVERDRCA